MQVLVDTVTGETQSWRAEFAWPDTDILVIRKAYPFADKILEAAKACPADAWTQSGVIGEGAEGKGYDDVTHRSSSSIILVGDTELAPDAPASLKALSDRSRPLKAVEGSYISRYLERSSHATVERSSAYELLRYEEGQHFGLHVDAVRSNPVLGHRRISAVAFVNDDYEGGELHFPRQGITVWPEEGMLVLFPSNFTHPHEVLPVKRGTRYSIVAWYF